MRWHGTYHRTLHFGCYLLFDTSKTKRNNKITSSQYGNTKALQLSKSKVSSEASLGYFPDLCQILGGKMWFQICIATLNYHSFTHEDIETFHASLTCWVVHSLKWTRFTQIKMYATLKSLIFLPYHSSF